MNLLISSFRFTLDRAAAAHSATVARIHLRMALGALRLLRSAGADLAPLAEQLDAAGRQFAARGWLTMKGTHAKTSSPATRWLV